MDIVIVIIVMIIFEIIDFNVIFIIMPLFMLL